MNTDEAREPSQNDEVRIIYRQLVSARQQHRRSVGGEFEANAHEQFHDAVFDMYDELRARLKRREITSELWEEAELWPDEPIYHEVAMCPACGGHEPLETLDEVPAEIGKPCPLCDEADIEVTMFPKIDDNGQVEYKMVEGLKNLDKYRNRIEEEVVSYTDALGTHEETKTKQLLLDPYQLEIAADLLAEAMEVLGLYADATMKGDFETDEIR